MNTKIGTRCRRCRGNGRIAGYYHVAHGVCFACGGAGVHVTAAEIEAHGSARVAAEARAQAKLRAETEAFNARVAARENELGRALDFLEMLDE